MEEDNQLEKREDKIITIAMREFYSLQLRKE